MFCLIAGHKHSHNVWHDGIDFRSRCRRCNRPMVRALNGWRLWDGGDFDVGRKGHPLSDRPPGQRHTHRK
jgi:hypothetical protein